MNKTYSQYIDYIKRSLGETSEDENSLEFSDKDLTEYIKIAFSEVKPYLSTRNRVTLPFSSKGIGQGGAIELEKTYKIRAISITAVKRGSSQGYLNSGSTLGGWSTWDYNKDDGTYPYVPIFSLGGSYCYGRGYNVNNDPWSTEKLMIKGINETSGDGHFIFDYGKQLLLIYFNERLPSSVTIDYIPEYRTAEDINDDYWTMIIQRYSLAMTKIALGQYRGKYSNVEGSPFKLDYERLIKEGNEELTELKQILEENLLNYRFD